IFNSIIFAFGYFCKKNNSMKFRCWYFLVFILLTSCSNPTLLDEGVQFDNLIWNRLKIIEMEAAVVDVNVTYDLKFRFVHTESYPTDHIATNITLYFPDGGMRSRDYTFRLQDKDLKWTGTLKNNLYTQEFPVITGLTFPEAGKVKLRLENKMTKFNMPGIAEVGVVLTREK
ncbi:MAG: hypothetical protein Q8T08_14930, partial [Ignavibacteria bacterium]|nr:hypothetical protein [Ignavibacteria bacterium]